MLQKAALCSTTFAWYSASLSQSKGEPAEQPDDLPEGYKVLCQGLRGLALDLAAYDENGNLIPLTERDKEIINKKEKEKNNQQEVRDERYT